MFSLEPLSLACHSLFHNPIHCLLLIEFNFFAQPASPFLFIAQKNPSKLLA